VWGGNVCGSSLAPSGYRFKKLAAMDDTWTSPNGNGTKPNDIRVQRTIGVLVRRSQAGVAKPEPNRRMQGGHSPSTSAEKGDTAFVFN